MYGLHVRSRRIGDMGKSKIPLYLGDALVYLLQRAHPSYRPLRVLSTGSADGGLEAYVLAGVSDVRTSRGDSLGPGRPLSITLKLHEMHESRRLLLRAMCEGSDMDRSLRALLKKYPEKPGAGEIPGLYRYAIRNIAASAIIETIRGPGNHPREGLRLFSSIMDNDWPELPTEIVARAKAWQEKLSDMTIDPRPWGGDNELKPILEARERSEKDRPHVWFHDGAATPILAEHMAEAIATAGRFCWFMGIVRGTEALDDLKAAMERYKPATMYVLQEDEGRKMNRPAKDLFLVGNAPFVRKYSQRR